jgi:hypothetical protein
MSETNNNTLNEETKKFISDSSERLKQGAMYYKAIEKKWDDTPLMIKILNILLSVVLTYLTTGVFYNLFFSILFFIVSFCFIFIYNKAFAFFYLILYIIFMTKIITEKNTAYGAVIPITDMQKNNKPLNYGNQFLQTTMTNYSDQIKEKSLVTLVIEYFMLA